MTTTSPERKSAWILAAIAGIEGSWVALNWIHSGSRFWRYLGFAPEAYGRLAGWIAASVVAAVFVGFSARLQSVRENLLRPSRLKLLGLAVAFAAGILEEAIFRKMIMDGVAAHDGGVLLQIAAAALSFGVAHGIWGLFGRSARVAIGATITTGALGAALAVVYLFAGRSVAPCVVAHIAIDALIEPGLVLAACRGEMSRARA